MFYMWIFAYNKNNQIWNWSGSFNCFSTKNYVGHAVCFSEWKLDQPSSITPLGRYLQEVFCWWKWRTQPSCTPTVQIMFTELNTLSVKCSPAYLREVEMRTVCWFCLGLRWICAGGSWVLLGISVLVIMAWIYANIRGGRDRACLPSTAASKVVFPTVIHQTTCVSPWNPFLLGFWSRTNAKFGVASSTGFLQFASAFLPVCSCGCFLCYLSPD